MANQATSRADDLMVGAGALYFKRSDDPNGLHHLGNVEEFNITTDVTTVEKNSSMDKDRELMASVVTAVNPTGTMTMNEYNPYNLALGLYGREGVYTQLAQTLTNAVYTVDSVPGVVELKDANGNRLYDVSGVTVGASSTTASTFTATVPTSTMVVSTTTVTDDSLTDALGGKVVASGSAGATGVTIYVQIEVAPTTAGDLDGMVLNIIESNVGTATPITVPAGPTYTWSSTANVGLSLVFDVSASATDNFTANQAFSQFAYVPASSGYVEGTDYIASEQMLRAGLIQIPSGSSITAGSTILVSGSVPGNDYVTVSGADAGEIQGQLLFVGDPNIGGQYVIEGWKVKVRPDGDLTGLISDDFGSFSLTVQFLADKTKHPKEPYYKVTHIGRADGAMKSDNKYDPEY